MQKKLKKDTTMLLLFSVVFSFCSCCIIVGGISRAVTHFRFYKTALETTGTITDIETYQDSDGDSHHQVFVSYMVDGQAYTDIRLSHYTSSMHEGASISLFYDPKNPEHIETKTGSTFEIVMLFVMAVVFGGIGIGFFIPFARQKKKNRLKKTGLCIRLPIAKLEINDSIRINGVPANYIICEGTNPITGRKQHFMSDNYYTFLDTYMAAGDIVPIYIDQKHPDKFYVDAENVEPGDKTEPVIPIDESAFTPIQTYDTFADRETAASAKDNYSANLADDNYSSPF